MTTQQEINKFIYLPVYLSDYVSQSRKLTMLQRGAFIDLSVLYFQENLKLQYTKEQIYRMVFAFEKEEREAVDFILDNYFIKSENKPIGFYWVSNQLNEIGDKVLKKLNASRENGKKGGRGNKSENKPIGSNLINLEKTILNESKLNQIKLNENNLNNNISIDFQEFYNNYPLQGTKVKGNRASSEKKYNLLRKNGVSKEELNNALANYKEEIKANSWQQTKRVEFWLTKWETYQLTDSKQELKQIENKLKEIEPLADIKIKDKNIIIILPTFDSLRLNKEIINKELTPLCNNIGYTTQLTNN
jgi:uncharacterized protein YdaU (DUF1376 family)